jgi:hypothetical protein
MGHTSVAAWAAVEVRPIPDSGRAHNVNVWGEAVDGAGVRGAAAGRSPVAGTAAVA